MAKKEKPLFSAKDKKNLQKAFDQTYEDLELFLEICELDEPNRKRLKEDLNNFFDMQERYLGRYGNRPKANQE